MGRITVQGLNGGNHHGRDTNCNQDNPEQGTGNARERSRVVESCKHGSLTEAAA